MKTYQDILNDTIENDFRHEITTNVSPEERAAKEYAKQWIDKAATIGRMYAGLNSANAIEDLKSKIDSQ